MNKKLSMFSEIRGYTSGKKKYPIYAPQAGALVTQAFIHCSQCGEAISSNMGPRSDAWCIPCTDNGVEVAAKEKKAARKKAAAERVAKRKEAEALAKAKLQTGGNDDD